ncbi:hypothetical protein [Nocardia sp. BMG51109]|uniref:hypothetical protein n=1 Tax=Nocardia sp. BMG51109 TaxID=1056816 RepID=UPI000462EB84|nr:hypothetical protein [Nocardia sp. BMG51109]
MADDNPYPNLGFNPAAGVPADLDTMSTAVKSASDTVTECNRMLSRLQNSTDAVWQGEAADAFRKNFDQTLGADLRRAQDSLGRAVGVLQGWHGVLIAHRDVASRLDTEMAAAAQARATAQTAYDNAKANPDLGLAGKQVPTEQLAAVQSRLNAATTAVDTANTALTEANAQVASILAQAGTLKNEHEGAAEKAAQELRDAAGDFAPDEPGLWDRLKKGFGDALKAVGDWLSEHKDTIRNVLSVVSAVSGVLALFPPLTAVFGPIALAAGAGVLAMDLSDPELRDDLLHGSWKEKLSAGGTLFGDTLSILPGGKGLALGATAAFKGADDVGRLGGFLGGFSEGASSAGIGAKMITGSAGAVDNISMKLASPTGISAGLTEFGAVTGTATTARGAELLSRTTSLGLKSGSAVGGGGE